MAAAPSPIDDASPDADNGEAGGQPAPARASPAIADRASRRQRWVAWLRLLILVIVATEMPSTPLSEPEPQDMAVAASETDGMRLGAGGRPLVSQPPAATVSVADNARPAGIVGQSERRLDEPTRAPISTQPRAGSAESNPQDAAAANRRATAAGGASPTASASVVSSASPSSSPSASGPGRGGSPPREIPPTAAPRPPAAAAGISSTLGIAGSEGLAGTLDGRSPDQSADATATPSSVPAAAEARGGASPTAAAAVGPPADGTTRASELAEAEACPSDAPKDRVVLVFDGSLSMGLPVDMPHDIEADLDRRMAGGDNQARTEYRRWLATDQPKRIDFAKRAVGEMLTEADPKLEIGAVAFTACLEIARRPFVGFDARGQLAGFINGVTPHRGGDTPLTNSIRAALDMLQGARGRVIVLTDGQETCGGDLCTLAREAARNQAQARVDVIDLSGHSNAACIAEATGGFALNYADVRGRISLSSLLVRAANQCPARPAR
jgi:hypothetical protein